MKPRHATPIGWFFALAASLSACSREPLTGPPTLRTGRDECAECGMLINADRFAAGVLAERDGRREHLIFDDIGCMFDWERSGERVVIDRFVHDLDGGGWINAAGATLLLAPPDALQTPMGTGIVAFATREAAQRAHEAHGGQLLDVTGASAARAAWMETRYGKPKEGH